MIVFSEHSIIKDPLSQKWIWSVAVTC
jgi:hypothetical protein